MLELLLIWGSSVLVTFGMEVALCLEICKKVADAGYKLDLNKFTEDGFGGKILQNTSFSLANTYHTFQL